MWFSNRKLARLLICGLLLRKWLAFLLLGFLNMLARFHALGFLIFLRLASIIVGYKSRNGSLNFSWGSLGEVAKLLVLHNDDLIYQQHKVLKQVILPILSILQTNPLKIFLPYIFSLLRLYVLE